jgi:hypothetical protein
MALDLAAMTGDSSSAAVRRVTGASRPHSGPGVAEWRGGGRGMGRMDSHIWAYPNDDTVRPDAHNP